MTTVFLHAYLPSSPAQAPEQWAQALTAQLPGVTVDVVPHRPGEVVLLLEPDQPDTTSTVKAVHDAAARLVADPHHFGLAAVIPTGDLSN